MPRTDREQAVYEAAGVYQDALDQRDALEQQVLGLEDRQLAKRTTVDHSGELAKMVSRYEAAKKRVDAAKQGLAFAAAPERKAEAAPAAGVAPPKAQGAAR